ncbi:MAG: MotA/TolQ/ExbB proton channel family protein [Pseudomonadota bacterium]
MEDELQPGADGETPIEPTSGDQNPLTEGAVVNETPAETSADVAVTDMLGPAGEFLEKGGFAIWAIAALSVVTLAIILWKLWRLSHIGVWRRDRAEAAVNAWLRFDDATALETAIGGSGVRAKVVAAAIASIHRPGWSEHDAREETVRVAKSELASARSGLRALELIATIAPLLGLFGTVLGMIAAFQQLQASGARADPSALAGGIWEALLTTAAGMAVAIPASAALTWFESVADRLRLDLEDVATRIFTRPEHEVLAHAAE